MGRKELLLQCFRAGWARGASGKEQAEEWGQIPDRQAFEHYQRGWNRGREAALLSAWDECERLDYDAKVRHLVATFPIIDAPKEG